MKVIDIEYKITRHKTKVYGKRVLSAITQFVVHHTAGQGTPDSFAKYHVNHHGWAGIGYHFLIDKDGTIYKTNSLDVVCYGVAGQNTKSINACMIGNYENEHPTYEALKAMQYLYYACKDLINIKMELAGHRQKGTTKCPGDNLFKHIRENEFVV